MKKAHKMKAVAHVTEDSYLLGFDELTDGREQTWRYWHPAGDSDCENDCHLETWEIPADEYPELSAIGTMDQTFSDGYSAMRHLAQTGTCLS